MSKLSDNISIKQPTIYALSTPYGKSGVAVIRISGTKAVSIAERFCRVSNLKSHNIKFNNIYNPQTGKLIDQGLLLFFKGPKSFTGEDMLELQVHGSLAVIRELQEALSSEEGVRIAERGEFTRRAFYNGKMDLTTAEGIKDLIEAETSLQKEQALQGVAGHIRKIYEGWREDLLRILAHLEAYIDFPEEDIPENIITDIENEVKYLASVIKNHLQQNQYGERLREGFKIAILGAPNAGKSTLLNKLAKRDVAITSEIAGTTRDIIEVHLDIKGLPIIIYDTAGLRDTSEQIEQEGIKRALEKASESDMILHLIDGQSKTDNIFNEELQLKVVKVINKADILTKPLNNKEAILISAKTEQGLEELVDYIESYILEKYNPQESMLIIRERHRDALRATLEFLQEFNLSKAIELSTEDIRLASRALGKITGTVEVEELLDKIFNEFCIGK